MVTVSINAKKCCKKRTLSIFTWNKSAKLQQKVFNPDIGKRRVKD